MPSHCAADVLHAAVFALASSSAGKSQAVPVRFLRCSKQQQVALEADRPGSDQSTSVLAARCGAAFALLGSRPYAHFGLAGS